jgi:hypothetical protein
MKKALSDSNVHVGEEDFYSWLWNLKTRKTQDFSDLIPLTIAW